MIPDRDHPIAAVFTDSKLQITLANQRQIYLTLADYPVLDQATPEQRAHVQLSLGGLY